MRTIQLDDDASTNRLASIDLFRGLTIAAMIWVNDVARVREIPLIFKHAPEAADAMTIPDVVFPAFLFIVGMSIPLALGRRLDRGESTVRVLGHVMGRVLGLLAVGVLMVNMHDLNESATGMSRWLWEALVYVGVILAWNVYPRRREADPGTRRPGRLRPAFLVLRLGGVALLIALAVMYRGTDGQQITWLKTRWWGILGLIGWAYLVGTCSYLLLRRQPAGLVGVWAFMLILCIADKNGALGRFAVARAIDEYVSLGGHIGGHASIVLAGMLAVLLPRNTIGADRRPSAWRHLAWLLAVAAVLAAAGTILRWPYQLSKIRVTPAWCLYCSAICYVIYAKLYWLVDLHGWRLGTGLVRTVGGNALLAYLLPSLIYSLLALLHIDYLNEHLVTGLAGLARSTGFTLVMMVATALLTRLHVRLRL